MTEWEHLYKIQRKLDAVLEKLDAAPCAVDLINARNKIDLLRAAVTGILDAIMSGLEVASVDALLGENAPLGSTTEEDKKAIRACVQALKFTAP